MEPSDLEGVSKSCLLVNEKYVSVTIQTSRACRGGEVQLCPLPSRQQMLPSYPTSKALHLEAGPSWSTVGKSWGFQSPVDLWFQTAVQILIRYIKIVKLFNFSELSFFTYKMWVQNGHLVGLLWGFSELKFAKQSIPLNIICSRPIAPITVVYVFVCMYTLMYICVCMHLYICIYRRGQALTSMACYSSFPCLRLLFVK